MNPVPITTVFIVTCTIIDSPGTDNDHREGGLRLVGGTSSAGAVELFLNGKWNRICSVNFKLTHAHVACRQLGFSGATGFYNDGRYVVCGGVD